MTPPLVPDIKPVPTKPRAPLGVVELTLGDGQTVKAVGVVYGLEHTLRTADFEAELFLDQYNQRIRVLSYRADDVIALVMAVRKLAEANGFDKIIPGTVVKIDLATNAVSYFGSPDSLGVLDGIEPDGQNVLVTDNAGGRLLLMAPGETGVEVGKLEPGAADLEYVPGENLIVVPQTQTNMVVAYRWTP